MNESNNNEGAIAALAEPLFEVRVGLLKAVMVFASQEKERADLYCVRFAWQYQTLRLTGANNHAMAEARVPAPDMPGEAIGYYQIRMDHLKQLVLGLKHKAVLEFLPQEEDGYVPVRVKDDSSAVTFVWATRTPTYVNTEVCWPKPVAEHYEDEEAGKTWVFYPQFLELAIKAAKELKAEVPLVMWRNETKHAAMGCYLDDAREELVMALMPARPRNVNVHGIPTWNKDTFHSTLVAKLELDKKTALGSKPAPATEQDAMQRALDEVRAEKGVA